MGQDADREEGQQVPCTGGMKEHGGNQHFDAPALQGPVAPAPKGLAELAQPLLFQRPGHAVLPDHRVQPEAPEAFAAAGPGRIGRRADRIVVAVGMADGEVAEHAKRRTDPGRDHRLEVVGAMAQIVPDRHAGDCARTRGQTQPAQQGADVVMGRVCRHRVETRQ